MLSRLHLRLPYREDGIFSILSLAAFAIPLVFTIGFAEDFETIKFTLFLILTGWTCMAAAVFFLLKPRPLPDGSLPKASIRGGKLFGILLLLGWILIFLSTFFSEDVRFAVFGFYPRFTNGLLFFTAWTVATVMLLMVLDRQKWLWLLNILVFDSLLIALYSILESKSIGFYAGISETSAFNRGVPSFLGNPNFSTMFTATVIPMALTFFHYSKKLGAKIYYGLTIFAILASLAILSSRGALLGLAVGLLCYVGAIIIHRAGGKKVAIISSLLFVALFAAFFSLSRPQAVGNNAFEFKNDDNVSSRLYVWDISRQAILKHPWLGYGPGNFTNLFEQFRGKNLAGPLMTFDDAHNLFLQLGSTVGLPFMLTFLALIGLSCMSAFRLFIRSKDLYALALCCSLIIFSIIASFTPVPVPCWLLLAILLASVAWTTTKQVAIKAPRLVGLTGLVLGAVLLLAGIGLIVGEYYYVQGLKLFRQHKYQDSAKKLSLALFIDPINSATPLYLAADKIYLAGSREAADKIVNHYISFHPHSAPTFLNSSSLYHLLYQSNKQPEYLTVSIQQVLQTIQMDPNYSANYSRASLYYYEAGDFRKALDYGEQSLSLYKEDINMWLLIAKIFQVQGRKESLVYALKQAAALNPDIRQIKNLLVEAQKTDDVKKIDMEVNISKSGLE